MHKGASKNYNIIILKNFNEKKFEYELDQQLM